MFIPKEFFSLGLKIEDFNLSYILPRKDIINLIKLKKNPEKILDVGCSIGTLGIEIRKIYKNAEITGIEYDSSMAQVAKNFLDNVIIGNVEEIDLFKYFKEEYFDVIIFADILEHLKDPWSVLKNFSKLLKDDGIIIASLPNVRHYSVIFSLVFLNYWPYRKRGINDKTHLRFFTSRNIKNMFDEAGIKIIKMKRKYRIIESPNPLNIFSRMFFFPGLEDFITYQFLVVGRK